MICNDEPNDSHYAQTICGLIPGEKYQVKGMIKLTSIDYPEGNTWECGATISRISTSDHSVPINEPSQDWEPVEFTEVIGCRLGYYSSIVSGTIFCDNLVIEKVSR